jgi:hypothetical protein
MVTLQYMLDYSYCNIQTFDHLYDKIMLCCIHKLLDYIQYWDYKVMLVGISEYCYCSELVELL